MSMPEKAPVIRIQERQIPVTWPKHQEAAVMANVFNVSLTPDGVVLTIGQASLPIFTGTPEDQVHQAQELPEVEPIVIARIVMTPAKAAELIAGIAPLIAVAQNAAQLQAMTTGSEGATP
jgi:hypothetical protein